MHLTDEQRQVGKENFQSVIGSDYTRRDFLMQGIAAGIVSGAGLGSMYFGYGKSVDKPLRVGFIGTGDEGNVLLGAITPSYIQVVAIADIRPYSIWRAFHGDHSSESALKARTGLMTKYGWKSEDEARKHVKVYSGDYHELLADPDVEAVVIALPLHLHHIAAIEAMRAGKHVLTEKLMGHSVAKCKAMGRASRETGKILVTGHQRHYSILYDNAVDTMRRGLIGEIHHIRAQWHRDNLPGRDSWQQPMPTDKKLLDQIAKLEKELNATDAVKKLGASAFEDKAILLDQLKAQVRDSELNAESYGYQAKTLGDSYQRSAIEELIRWRLWHRTGGGLMAELGSHQLDAAGIFISAMSPNGEKAVPLTVTAVGGRHIFPLDRECEDHVYCTYEFPGPKHKEDPNSKIGVFYSSINGNGYGGYGEVVLGTKGTLILEREQEVMMFGGSNVTTKVGVGKSDKGAVVLDTTHSGGQSVAVGKLAVDSGPISRGYTEELEHWAWCIRNPDKLQTDVSNIPTPIPVNVPRCHPKIALGDAVIALTTNIAIRENRRIEFKKEWFDIDSDETPDGESPVDVLKNLPSSTAVAPPKTA